MGEEGSEGVVEGEARDRSGSELVRLRRHQGRQTVGWL